MFSLSPKDIIWLVSVALVFIYALGLAHVGLKEGGEIANGLFFLCACSIIVFLIKKIVVFMRNSNQKGLDDE